MPGDRLSRIARGLPAALIATGSHDRLVGNDNRRDPAKGALHVIA